MNTKTQYPFAPPTPQVTVYSSNASPPSYQLPPPPQYLSTAPTVNVSSNDGNIMSSAAGKVAIVAVPIFMSGGANIAWSIGFDPATHGLVSRHMIISWFIGAIIGAIIGVIITSNLHKKPIMLFSAFLVVLGGVLLVALPDTIEAMLAALYIDGVANGLTFVTTIVLLGEISVQHQRGQFVSCTEVAGFSLGMIIQLLIFALSPKEPFDNFSTQMHGGESIFFGSVALLFACFFIRESPVFYLSREQEHRAVEVLNNLQRPNMINPYATQKLLDEHKRYMAVNDEYTTIQLTLQALGPLLKLCWYRGMVSLSFSVVTTVAFIWSTSVSTNNIAPYIIYGVARFVGGLICSMSVDQAGRRKWAMFAFIICGALAIIVAAMFGQISFLFSPTKMMVVMFSLIAYQFFAGFANTASSVYLSEAFPLPVKSGCIAFAFIVQMLVEIVIVLILGDDWQYLSNYFYAIGALSLFFGVSGFFILPETKNTSLREAQAKFKSLIATD